MSRGSAGLLRKLFYSSALRRPGFSVFLFVITVFVHFLGFVDLVLASVHILKKEVGQRELLGSA